MLLFKLAFLNIFRNPRRSLITILAVSVGLAALIFLWGFSDGTNEQMRENVIRLFTGHFQVHAKGFEKTLSPELMLPGPDKIMNQIENQAGFEAATRRVKCEALIGTTENSRGILLIGIDPHTEAKVTELHKFVKEGEFLAPGDDRMIVVGTRLAEKIHLELGDKVVIMTQAMDGTLAGYAYRIKGIFHSGSQQLDELSAFITLPSAQDLLDIGSEIHEIAVRIDERRHLPDYLTRLEAAVPVEELEILRWDELVPEVEQWAEWAESIIKTILIAVMIVIGVSIMNTVLMSVFERTRELGVMMALGTSPGQVIRLILLETVILEFCGILFGLMGGWAVVSYFGKAGIAFPDLEKAFSRSYMSTVIYTQVEPIHVVQSVVTLLFLTTLISIYPAWRAANTEPVKAIYHSA